MSLAIKLARAEATGDADRLGMRGDPGIGSFFKKVGGAALGAVRTVGGVVIDIAPGPVGIVARKARGFLRGRRVGPGPEVRGAPGPARVRPGVGRGFRRDGRQFAGGVRGTTGRAPSADIELEFGRQDGFPSFLDGGEPVTAGAPGRQIGCPSGMRPNKSSYFRRSPAGGVVFIEEGTVCVKSRRRNPLNPRALDRAVGRVASFARADSRSRKKIKAAARKIG